MPENTSGGPFVQVAAICTTPLIEQQGALSIIRIQDRIQIAGVSDQMQPQPLGNLWLVLALKAGEMQGKYNLYVTPILPSGERVEGPNFSVLFEGQERGAVVAFPLQFIAQEEGLYWFEVKLEEAVLTKIPLRVMYQKIQAMPGMPFSQPPAGD